MLKTIYLNKKKLPIPIPIRTLKEALDWVDDHIIDSDHSVTRIKVNGQDLEWSGEEEDSILDFEVNQSMKVFFQIDSPMDISVQTIDALRNLINVMLKSLKPVAVDCWKTQGEEGPEQLSMVKSDLDLVIDLLDHIMVLLDGRINFRNILNTSEVILEIESKLSKAIDIKDWKLVAKILLKELEVQLLDLTNELSSLQKMIFEMLASSHEFRKGFVGAEKSHSEP